MRLLTPVALVVALLATATAAEAAPKVAVVDMVKVMRKHPESTAIEETFKQARQNAEDNLKSAQTELEGLKKKIEGMIEEHPERPRLERQYQLQLNTMKFNYEWAVKSAVREYARGLEQLYRAVQTIVANHAREQGIDIVLLKTDPSEPMKPVDPEDFALKSRLRVVVHADARADITDAVLAKIQQ